MKTIGALAVSMTRKKIDWILTRFTFIDNSLLYLPIISTIIFEGKSNQGVTKLVIKPFGISQT